MPADHHDADAITAELNIQAQHLAMIFNSARDMMLLAKVEPGQLFRVISVNRPYIETIRSAGYALSEADFAGRTFAEIHKLFGFDAATVAEISSRFAEVIRTGRPLEYDEVTRTPAGVFHGRTTIAPIPDESGACAYLLYSSQDVTARKRAEKAQRESEAKFVAAFRVSPDLISITDYETGRYIEVNGAHEAFFGHSRGEMVGHTPLELGIVREQDSRREIIRRLEQEGRVRDYRVDALTRDGRAVIISVNAEVLEIDGRKCILRVSRDVTAAVQAERALRESEEKFTKAFKSSPDAISVHELESGRYVEVNDGFLRLFGHSREKVIGRTPLELGVWAEVGVREAFVERLRREGSVRQHSVKVRDHAGEIRLCELSAEVFEVAGRLHNVTVLRDVTEQRRAEQALRESEEKFAKAFRSSPQALLITEIPSGRYIDVNLGFERITGYSQEEVIGRTSLEIGIWENLADRDELMRRIQRDGWARDMEFVFRGKDQRRLVTRCSFELIEISGRKCLLSVIEDITEQRRAAEQKAAVEALMRQNQKLEALGTLAGGIAHDFNNILTAIIVNQELAQMDIGDPDSVQRRLGEIGMASMRAKDLVRQILTFSRQQSHEKQRQHLQRIVREALGLLRASLPATIEIVQQLAPDSPPVLADGSQIHQVVMNLCTNAAHAMRDRPGRLTVRLTGSDLDEGACRNLPGLQPGRYAQLTVADTGHGMETAVLSRIFEPFFTTKGPGEGTGLGLPMVHGILKEHGGGIFVQSTPGEGTTFELYFPEAADSNVATPSTDIPIVEGRGEAVLVVDDEASISGAVGAMLNRIGYRVTTFNDPQAALEYIRTTPDPYALLLTDRTMPRLSGPELIAAVRKHRPDLPALMMSGLNSTGGTDDLRGAEYGMIAKPINIADLSGAVRRAIDARQSTTR